MKNREEVSVLDAVLADVDSDGETRTPLDKLIAASGKIRSLERSNSNKDESLIELEGEFAQLQREMQECMDPTKLADAGSIAKMHELAGKLKTTQGQIARKRDAIAQAENDVRDLIIVVRDLANEVYDETFATVKEEAA